MRPKPRMPRVAWCTSAPRNCLRYQPFHPPARTCASDSTTRRAVDRISAQVKSAVLSSRTPGVLVAMTPALEHAARSMLLKPTAMLQTALSVGQRARSCASTRSTRVVMAPVLPARFFASASASMGVSAWLAVTSKCWRRYSRTSSKISRVTSTFGFMAWSTSSCVDFRHSGLLFIRSLSPSRPPREREESRAWHSSPSSSSLAG